MGDHPLIPPAWTSKLLDYLFPRFCPLCSLRSPGPHPVCPACIAALPRFPRPDQRRSYPQLKLAGIFSYGPYDGALRQLIHDWKLSGHQDLEALLAELALRVVPPLAEGSVLVPVPSTRRQGRDAVSSLGQRLARSLGLPCLELVRRETGSPRQLGKDRAGRQRLAESKFSLQSPPRGRPLLLFDDIITSGATLNAVSRRLQAAGAGEIRAWTLAARLFGREDHELA